MAEAWTAAELGDVEHARAAAEEALALLKGLDPSVLTIATHAHLASSGWRSASPIVASSSCAPSALPDFPQIEPGRRCWLYAVLARAELARGNLDAAAEWLDRSEIDGRRVCSFRSRKPGRCTRARCSRSRIATSGAPPQLALLGGGTRGGGARTGPRRPLPDARGQRAGDRGRARAGDRSCCATLNETWRPAAPSATATRRRVSCAGSDIGSSARQRRGRPGDGLGALSGREREIAERVALGRTNREIASELFLAEKTVEGHLTSIFGKLGVSARAAVAEAVGRVPHARRLTLRDP